MDVKHHRPIFADRVKITSEWNAGANVAKTFAKYGWVPPSVAAAQAQSGAAVAHAEDESADKAPDHPVSASHD